MGYVFYFLLTVFRIIIGAWPAFAIRAIWRKQLSIWSILGWCIAIYFYIAILNGIMEGLGLQYAAFLIIISSFSVLRIRHLPWDRRPKNRGKEAKAVDASV